MATETKKAVRCWVCKGGVHGMCAFSDCSCKKAECIGKGRAAQPHTFEPETCPHANTTGLEGDRQACDDCGFEATAARDADGYLVLDLYRGDAYYQAYKAAHPGAYERRAS